MPWLGPLKIKVQLYCSEERAFGPGRADLLEAIDRAGSISAAGRALGMSYRYTWLLVDSMNRCFAEKLVEATAGAGRRSGATLTDFGREVLAAYRRIEGDIARAADGADLAALRARLRPEPLPPHHGKALPAED
ncbi:MAG: winged helix-turn-helix domain-containing protein [Sphingomonadales bacterium]